MQANSSFECRFFDGSIDKLDCYMAKKDCLTAPNWCTDSASAASTNGTGHHQAAATNRPEDNTPSQPTGAHCQPNGVANKHLLNPDAASSTQCHVLPNPTTAACTPSEQQQQAEAINSCPCIGQPGITARHRDKLTYQQFVKEFMQPNLPVMIQARVSTQVVFSSCSIRG